MFKLVCAYVVIVACDVWCEWGCYGVMFIVCILVFYLVENMCLMLMLCY